MDLTNSFLMMLARKQPVHFEASEIITKSFQHIHKKPYSKLLFYENRQSGDESLVTPS